MFFCNFRKGKEVETRASAPEPTTSIKEAFRSAPFTAPKNVHTRTQLHSLGAAIRYGVIPRGAGVQKILRNFCARNMRSSKSHPKYTFEGVRSRNPTKDLYALYVPKTSTSKYARQLTIEVHHFFSFLILPLNSGA